MLPHHGAARNFHREILEVAPDGQLFATADAGDAGLRPHEDLDEKLPRDLTRADIHVVTADPDRAIVEVSGCEEYTAMVLIEREGWKMWT
jgi:hypothetical protein